MTILKRLKLPFSKIVWQNPCVLQIVAVSYNVNDRNPKSTCYTSVITKKLKEKNENSPKKEEIPKAERDGVKLLHNLLA